LGIEGNPTPDLIVAVVDAGQLVRNLYLVLQLAELRVPLVIAVNMIDEVEGAPPDLDAVGALFGVPCVATNARSGLGVPELRRAIEHALEQPPRGCVRVGYPEQLRPIIDRIAEALPADWRRDVERDRALALWMLTSVEDDDELEGIPEDLRQRCREAHAESSSRDIDRDVIGTRYAFLDERSAELRASRQDHPPKRKTTERLDRVLLHPVFGFAAFLLVMLVVFQALFSWSDPAIGLVEAAVAWLGEVARAHLPAGVLRDLLTEGVLGGVGNVLVFLPQILLLFLFIGLLEDSGYMSRVAFLMDRIMRALGLHGRAFVPMLSGFACAVPAILATRTMERRRDRLLTILVIPLMTCSARLPVYTLIIAALFPPTHVWRWIPTQGLLMVSMYVLSVVVTLVATAVLGRTVVRGRRVPLILELPPYRVPNLRSVLRMMWERSRVFVSEAGTVILACSIVLWALLSFPRVTPASAVATTTTSAVATAAPSRPTPNARPEAQARAEQMAQSYAGRVGRALEPVLEPLGFDWKIGVGLIGAFAAREVFVSTMALVYGVGSDDDGATPLRERIRTEAHADGKSVYTPLTGLSLMVFFAFACQCMSTLAVVRKETKSWRWPVFLFGYMTLFAYVMSFLVYQGGRLLGFG
jgi:ferrous iron transport protein B